jgi:hypothetical protein
MSRRARQNLEFRFSLPKFLSDDAIRQNLILTSLYIFAFEVLKFAILNDVEFFLAELAGPTTQAPSKGETLEELLEWAQRSNARKVEAYRKRLRDYDRNKWKASYLFLADIGVISEKDVTRLKEIEKHRNEIAHELPRLLIDETLDFRPAYLARIREILGKIDDWQKDIEVAINPELAGKELFSGRLLVVDRILSVALSEFIDDDADES